jgi:hypothetical protein
MSEKFDKFVLKFFSHHKKGIEKQFYEKTEVEGIKYEYVNESKQIGLGSKIPEPNDFLGTFNLSDLITSLQSLYNAGSKFVHISQDEKVNLLLESESEDCFFILPDCADNSDEEEEN